MALAGLCVATLAAWLAPFGWPFELFAHFRLQYAATAVLLVPVLLGLRRVRLAALTASLAVVHLMPAVASLRAAEPHAACAGRELTFVAANLHYDNPDKQLFTDWLEGHPADVVALEEVTSAWVQQLAAVREEYPYQRLLSREDPYGIALLSRWPFVEVESVDLAGDALPSLAATIDPAGGEPVRVLALHTRWPVLPALARERNLALMRAAVLARASKPMPVVALGDLNLSPDAPEFAALLRDSGLRDAFAGRGWNPTWMAGFWPLALRIDHLLVSPGICVEQAQVGPEIGSDHRPIRARLRLGAAATRGS